MPDIIKSGLSSFDKMALTPILIQSPGVPETAQERIEPYFGSNSSTLRGELSVIECPAAERSLSGAIYIIIFA